jgi:hypothetical protein
VKRQLPFLLNNKLIIEVEDGMYTLNEEEEEEEEESSY